MPTFDFECLDCKHTFEFTRPFGNKEVPPCADCKSKNIKKLIAPPAIHFKGGGFYKTDSAPKVKDTPKEAPKSKKEEKPDTKEKEASKPKKEAKDSPKTGD